MLKQKNKKATLDTLSTKIDTLASLMESSFKGIDYKIVGMNGKIIGLGGKFSGLDVKIDGLDSKMDKGFKEAKEDNESLARMVANGFEQTANDISSLKESVITFDHRQEDIKLRLDSLAPHFEVKQLERRVKRLEDRAGLRHAVQS